MDELVVRSEFGSEIMAAMRPKRVQGLEAFSDRQLRLQPLELRIVHSIRNPNDTARPGQLRLGAEVMDEVQCIFLKGHPYRILLEGETPQSAQATCGSLDCNQPLPEIERPKSTSCTGCAYAEWDEGPTGKRIPPKCSESVALLGIRQNVAKQWKPFWFLCKKTAAFEAFTFLQEVSQDEKIGRLHQAVVKVTTKQMRNSGVVWYLPVFTITRLIDEPGLTQLAHQVVDLWYVPRIVGTAAPAEETVTVMAGEATDVGWETGDL